jgi:nitrogen fixation NifU-like protein
MDSEQRDRYQEIILDHDRSPHNCRSLDDATHTSEGHNPICGDRYRIFFRVVDDDVVDVAFDGNGCAISRASASIMTTLLAGLAVPEALARVDEAISFLTRRDQAYSELLGDLVALEGVRRIPTRQKCAVLAWAAARSALMGEDAVSTE